MLNAKDLLKIPITSLSKGANFLRASARLLMTEDVEVVDLERLKKEVE